MQSGLPADGFLAGKDLTPLAAGSPWSMVHGPWSMVHSPQQAAVCLLWTVDYRPWTGFRGPWTDFMKTILVTGAAGFIGAKTSLFYIPNMV